MEWLNYILPLVGVVIGGLLTPYVTAKMDNARAKRNLKPDLIKNVYLFFNLRKDVIRLNNDREYEIAANHYEVDMLRNNQPLMVKGQELEFEKREELIVSKIAAHSEKIIEIESLLTMVVAQFNIYYGKSVHNKVQQLIQPLIDESNEAIFIPSRKDITAKELSTLKVELIASLLLSNAMLDSKCKSVIEKIMNV